MFLSDLRIVIVGGDRALQSRYEALLRSGLRRRHVTTSVTDFAEARRCLASREVDVALLAPRIGGYEAMELLREYYPSGWSTPCVLLCSPRTADTDALALRLGAAGLIDDDTNLPPAQLEGIIESAISLQETRTRAVELAFRDPMTNLVSRPLWDRRLEFCFRLARRQKSQLGVALLDLDGFKRINDRYGAGIGDLLLQQVGFRVQVCARETDTVGRFSGDRFAMILPGITQSANMLVIARRLLSSLEAPFRVESASITLGATCGLALYPQHARDESELLDAALLALRDAKREARGRFRMSATTTDDGI